MTVAIGFDVLVESPAKPSSTAIFAEAAPQDFVTAHLDLLECIPAELVSQCGARITEQLGKSPTIMSTGMILQAKHAPKLNRRR